jgi:tripartite-type tricarboxylate transporter receptor subunit TctC
LQSPEFRENLLVMGADPFISTPQQFGALIKTDLARYAKLIRETNIRIE